MSTGQKIIKYVAIAFAVILIVGIFTGIFKAIGSLSGMTETITSGNGLDIYQYSEEQKILSIDIADIDVKIEKGTELGVKTKNEVIDVKQENNKLAVTEKNHNVFHREEEIVISIPDDLVFDKVYIANGAGKIDIKYLNCQDLELKIGAGKIVADELTTLNATNIDGGVGKVEIKNASLSNLDLDAGVGLFELNAALNGSTKIEAGVGELNINLLGDKESYSIYTEKGIGSINIDDKLVNDIFNYGNGENKINIKGGIGSINVKFK